MAELTAAEWQACAERLAQDPAAARTFLPDGKAPVMGEIFRNPRLADSLARIAAEGKDAFYTGALARAIAADLQARGGLLTADDLAGAHRRLGGHDQHDLSWLRRPRAAAQHPGVRGAGDAEHPGGLRHRGDGPQLRRPPPRRRRGQEDRLRRSRRLPGRSGVRAAVSAGHAVVEGVRGASPPGHRHGQGEAPIAPVPSTQPFQPRRNSPAATAATPSTSPPPTARATSSRSSSRCSAASAPASSPATPASPCTTAARASRSRRDIPTRSGRASGRCTPWCRR